jgi:hypothetical protein
MHQFMPHSEQRKPWGPGRCKGLVAIECEDHFAGAEAAQPGGAGSC